MKLKISQYYSQRDEHWASTLLGFNSQAPYTIGNYGCLITAFGNYIDKTPLEVNDILKANNGYVDGGNFVWSKSITLGLQQVYQSPFYSDPVTSQGLTKMRSLLDEGRPLITHIDFDPRDPDDDQHWLLVYGYDNTNVFYAIDSWTGLAITLDVYGGVERCVYEWRAYNKQLSKDEGIDIQTELDKIRFERDRNWGWFVAICEALGVGANVDAAVNEAKKLVDNDDLLVMRDKQIAEANTQITDLQAQITQLKVDHDDLTAQIATLTRTTVDQDAQIKSLQESLQRLQDTITQPDWGALKLIWSGIKKIMGRR